MAVPYPVPGVFRASSYGSVQTAVDEAVSEGGGRVVVDGPFSGQVSIVGSNIDVWIEADGAIQLGNGELSGAEEGFVVTVGDGTTAISSVTIGGPGLVDYRRDLQTTSATSGQTGGVHVHGPVSDVTVTCAVKNALGNAVYIEGQDTNNRAERVVVSAVIDNCHEGVLWEWADWVQVRGCRITNLTGEDGIEAAGASRYWVVEGNTIETVGQSFVDLYNGARYGVVRGNIMRECGTVTNAHGISVGGGSTTDGAFDVVISDNLIIAPGRAGVGFNTSNTNKNARILVRGNRIIDAGEEGVLVGAGLSAIDVRDNFVQSSQKDGIYHQGDDAAVSGNTCLNNNQSNGTSLSGIRLNSGGRLSVRDNVCFDDQGTPTQDYGVYAQSGLTNSMVELNTAYGNDNGQVLDQSPESTTVQGNHTPA